MTERARREYAAALRERYQAADKRGRGQILEADRGHRASVSRAAALSGANELDVVEPRPDSQHARDDLIPERVLGAHHQLDLVFTGLVPETRPRALPDRS